MQKSSKYPHYLTYFTTEEEWYNGEKKSRCPKGTKIIEQRYFDSIKTAMPPRPITPVKGKMNGKGQLFIPQDRATNVEYMNVTTPHKEHVLEVEKKNYSCKEGL